jgi:hypothetical protein
MKRVLFVGVLLAALAVIPVGVVLHTRGAEAVKVKINKKDFSKRGLSIVSAVDPAFDDLMAAYVSRHPDAPVERLKPFSFFVQNNTSQTVVACRVKWECVRADGTVIDKVIGETSLWALTNAVGDKTGAVITKAGMVIRPGTARFFSLAAPSESLDEQPISEIRSEEQAKELNRLWPEFEAYTDVTLSIDGSFFSDGGFVGLDTTRFFDEVKAKVDARHELLDAVQAGTRTAGGMQKAFEFIEAAANAPRIKIRGRSTPEEHYQHEKRSMAQDLLNIKKYKGDDKLLEEVNLRHSGRWPALRKL